MVVTQNGSEPPRVVGRYMLFDEIAAGGMATVRFGRLIGEVGFSRTVAVKCLHAHFAKDQEFAKMFLDEARLAARVRHPNVVPILDVVARDGELFLVMEYVQGESLSKLVRATRARKSRIPLRIVAAIIAGMLDGLHAAHEAKSEHGEALNIVHRDVSPQNVIVGLDGVSRVLDFGVAKAAGRLQTTREGQLKGKLAYMAPEQLKAEHVDRRTDIYAASVVLWEALTGRRLFKADDEIGVFGLVLKGEVPPPSAIMSSIPKGYDEVTLKGLHLDQYQRFATAREMAIALEKVAGVASTREVGTWVEDLARDTLRARADKIAELESVSTLSVQQMSHPVNPPPPPSSAALSSGSYPAATNHAPPPPPQSRRLPPPVPPPLRDSMVSGVHVPPPVSITQTSASQEDLDGEALTVISDTTASSLHLSAASAAAAQAPPQSVDPVSSHSQLTSLSMAQEPPPNQKPKIGILVAVILGALVMAGAAIGGVMFALGQNETAAGSVDAGVASNVPANPVQDAGGDEPSEIDLDAVDAMAAKDAALDAEDAPAEASKTTPANPATAKTRPPPTQTAVRPPPTHTAVQPPPTTTSTSKPPRGDCNPPYSIDARGVRVPKIQCL